MKGPVLLALLLMPIIPSLLYSSQAAEPELKADRGCVYGAGACNPCVPDVERQFSLLAEYPDGKYSYADRRGQHLPPFGTLVHRFGAKSHVQGFARVPGVGSETWFAVSRSERGDVGGGAGLLLAKMQVDGKQGEALGDQEAGASASQYFYPLEGMDHSSGMQMLGQTLAVAAECTSSGSCHHDPAWVDFFDLSDPARVRKIHRLVLDGSRSEPGQQRPFNPNAAFAAVTRLEDQSLLLFVGGARSETGWFYRSHSPTLGADTSWNLVQSFDRSQVRPAPSAWDVQYQNMNFLNECGTGNLYLLGTGSKGLTRRLDLYRVHAAQNGIQLSRVSAHSLGLSAPLHCHTRGGASVHVTPTGKMVFYCSAQLGALLSKRHRFAEYVGLPSKGASPQGIFQ